MLALARAVRVQVLRLVAENTRVSTIFAVRVAETWNNAHKLLYDTGTQRRDFSPDTGYQGGLLSNLAGFSRDFRASVRALWPDFPSLSEATNKLQICLSV